MPKLDVEQVLDRMVEVVPDAITQLGFKRDTCVLHTRTAVQVLRELGFKAHPHPTAVLVLNEAFYARALRGEQPTKETEQEWLRAGCWSVQIGRDPRTERQHEKGRYDGHLVTAVEGTHLLDLTLDQASRPDKAIHLEPGWVRDPEFVSEQNEGTTMEAGDPPSYICYFQLPGTAARYLNAPDWTHPPRDPSWRRLVGKLVAGLMDDLS